MAHSPTEDYIFSFLVDKGLPASAACGILANMYYESGFNPKNLQNSYESSLGYTDDSYTKAVDSGQYKRFSQDAAGYGLCQWTFSSRKSGLLSYAKKSSLSVGNIDVQLRYLMAELQSSEYSSLYTTLKHLGNTATGAYTAGYEFCKVFERPQQDTSVDRGNYAKSTYADYYEQGNTPTVELTSDTGNTILSIAKEQLAKPYKRGSTGPEQFDDAGLLYYCLTQVDYKIKNMSTKDYYNYFLGQGFSIISSANVRPSDLAFWKSDEGDRCVGIADGSGNIVYASPTEGVVTTISMPENSSIIRILDYSQSSAGSDDSSGGSSEISESTGEYYAISALDPHTITIEKNLSSIASRGYDYGYLIDMSHGGSFKFYIPEFTEEAGTNWDTVDIRGRSVQVHAYNHTSSRKISISLDLYAGVGVYAAEEGESAGLEAISRMHSDLNFVKSLEYPDYTNAIARPPSTVHLILGSAIDLVGVVSSVSVQHMKPLDPQDRAMYAKLNFTVTQIATNPPDWRDIRGRSPGIIASEDVSSTSTDGTDTVLNNSNPDEN